MTYHLSCFHSLNSSLSPSLSALSCHYFSTSLSFSASFPPHCEYRDLDNKPFKPHLLCSLITHAIFIHGCHSRRHIKAIIHSLFSSLLFPLFFAVLPPSSPYLRCSLSSSPAHPHLSVSHFHFLLLPLGPPSLSPIHSPALFPSAYIERARHLQSFHVIDREGLRWKLFIFSERFYVQDLLINNNLS